jgi:hypothetical protein
VRGIEVSGNQELLREYGELSENRSSAKPVWIIGVALNRFARRRYAAVVDSPMDLQTMRATLAASLCAP